MPEYPDIAVYLEALERRLIGRVLERVRIADVFVLRTARPPIDSLAGQRVTALRRIGKRIALGFASDCWLVIHLMIAGRLHWAEPGGKVSNRNVRASFLFETGLLTLTEAGTKHRAALHVVVGETGLAAQDPGGIDPMTCSAAEFSG